MSTATNEVLDVAFAKDLDLRTAAYVLAITKLNDFYTTRGIDIWSMLSICLHFINAYLYESECLYIYLFSDRIGCWDE